MIVSIYISDTNKLDLFKDESVLLNSSVADVNDVTKNKTDFIKSLSLPASNQNNNTFKHYYDANLDGGFDARVRVKASIFLDGMLYKEGKLSLNSVVIKNGVPESYNVTFYGYLVDLKDLFKDDKLAELDLSAFDFFATYENVKQGLSTSLYTGGVIYCLFSKKQLFFNSNESENTNTSTLANIAYSAGEKTGLVWSELSPSIKVIKVLEAIESKYGITFSRDFFGREDFQELYLWVNNRAEKDILPTSQMVDFDSGDTTYVDLATNIFTLTSEVGLNWFNFAFTCYPQSGYGSVLYTIKAYRRNIGDVDWKLTYSLRSIGQETLVFQDYSSGNYEYYFEVESSRFLIYTAGLTTLKFFTSGGMVFNSNYTTNASQKSLSAKIDISKNMPDVKVLDFMKGLFDANKIIVEPIGESSFYANSVNEYYAEGQIFDLTKYVDVNNHKVSKGKVLNEVVFGFEEPTTILSKEFKKNNDEYYGDEDVLIYEDETRTKLLDGESVEYALPFEQIIYERLSDLNDDSQTNIQYAAIIDENLNAVSPKLHLHYIRNENINPNKIAIRNDVGDKEALVSLNVPRYTSRGGSPAFLFSEEVSTWDSNLFRDNLYSRRHSKYIEALFNKKRRDFMFKAQNVPLRIMLQLGFDDVIKIKDDYYRMDKYEYNLTDQALTINAVNTFDNTINGFYPENSTVIVNSNPQTTSVYVVNLLNYSTNKIDEGFGITWLSVSNTGNNLELTVTENETGVDRLITLEVTNTDTLQEFSIKLIQTASSITADNDVITVDTDLITADSI